jgi:hypothetical protein
MRIVNPLRTQFSRGQPKPFRSFTVSLTCLVILGSYVSPGPSMFEQDKLDIRVVLELPYDDQTAFPPRAIIDACSDALAQKTAFSNEVLARIYQKRGDAHARLRGCPESFRNVTYC